MKRVAVGRKMRGFKLKKPKVEPTFAEMKKTKEGIYYLIDPLTGKRWLL